MKRVTVLQCGLFVAALVVALISVAGLFAACDSPLNFPENTTPARPVPPEPEEPPPPPPPPQINLSVDTPFRTEKFGYSQLEMNAYPAVLSITNTGEVPTGPLTVSLSGADIQIGIQTLRITDVFVLLDADIEDIEPGDTAEFRVQHNLPGDPLPLGTYPFTVAVNGENLNESKPLTFTVDFNAVINLADSNPGNDPGPVPAYTWSGETYTIMHNKAVRVTGSTTERRVEVIGGASAYVFLDGASIELQSADVNPFKVNGNANVTIAMKEGTTNVLKTKNNYTASDKAALNVAQGATLTIEGPGALVAENPDGDDSSAGIGGDGNVATKVGTIIINGGTVTVTGGGSASGAGAGIGCGLFNTGWEGITINGGTVIASTAAGGAGIGGADQLDGAATGGAIVINGGDVTATAENGAGIGRGLWGTYSVNITIAGGTVTASSVSAGKAISDVTPTMPASYTWSDSNNTNGSPLATTSTAFPGTPYAYNASRKWVQIIAPDAPVP